MKRAYTKPALDLAQQLDQLKRRGMQVADEPAALHYLQHLNYYRLGAYWLPFEADHATHRFQPGTTFDAVLNLYVFDRELRLLVLDAIERVEVSVRAQWAYQMGHRHGAHSHLDPSLARRPEHWQRNLVKLTEEVERSDEVFIRHLRKSYAEQLPPIWAVCEVMSLGLLSRWYDNLKPSATRRAIASVYGVDDAVLASWLHHAAFIRNTCAHHSRVWNREFTITPLHTRTKPEVLTGQFVKGSRKLYNTLVILGHLLDIVCPAHRWRERLRTLLERHQVPVAAMDFPGNWQARSIWRQEAAA